MGKPVLTKPELTEFENIRLHNIANMYVNIAEDESRERAIAYLVAQLKTFTFADVKPFITAVYMERGYDVSE